MHIYDYESRNSDEAGEKSTHSALFSSHPINSVNAKNRHIEYFDTCMEYQMKSIYKTFCIDGL
jgi:hypothetical protein